MKEHISKYEQVLREHKELNKKALDIYFEEINQIIAELEGELNDGN